MKRTPPVITVEGLDTPEAQELIRHVVLEVYAERLVRERQEREEAS